MRYFLLLFLLAGFPFDLNAQQSALYWDRDTVRYFYEGCSAPNPDTIEIAIINISGEKATLVSLNNSSSRYEVVEPILIDSLTINPGQSLQVKVAHTGRFNLNRTRDFLVLTGSVGTKDTLIIESEVTYAGVFGLQDTIIVEPTELGRESMTKLWASITSNFYFILDHVEALHSNEITITGLSNGDTLHVGSQIHGYVTYRPTSTGYDTAYVRFSGRYCDSLYSVVVIFSAYERTRDYPHWTRSQYSFTADCADSLIIPIVMRTAGTTPAHVDSLSFANPDWMYQLVSSDPPDRFKDFAMLPGSEVTYYVRFHPERNLPSWMSENTLLIHSSAGVDTTRLIGEVMAPDLEIAPTYYSDIVYADSTFIFTDQIFNTGTAPFVVTDTVYGGSLNVRLLAPELGTVIAAGDTASLVYSIAPNRIGRWYGYVAIMSESCDTLYRNFNRNVQRLKTVARPHSIVGSYPLASGGVLLFGEDQVGARFTLINSVGQACLKSQVPTNFRVEIDYLPSGVYWVVFAPGVHHSSRRILK